MCFVFIWEQTATCATYSINWLVFIAELKSVYSAVRTGSLNKAVCLSSVKGLIWYLMRFFWPASAGFHLPSESHRLNLSYKGLLLLWTSLFHLIQIKSLFMTFFSLLILKEFLLILIRNGIDPNDLCSWYPSLHTLLIIKRTGAWNCVYFKTLLSDLISN